MTAARRLRVAFDVTPLSVGDTGVARYTRELGTALDALGVALVRFAIGRGRHAETVPAGTRRLRVPLRAVHAAWAVAGLPTARQLAPRCDLVHTTDLIPPPGRLPVVLTVHDLDALAWPALHPRRAAEIQARQLTAARERAAVVLAVSRATAGALVDHGVDEARVVVAPNGVTALPAPDASIVPPGGRYLLAVGALNPRKGFDTLVGAFARAALPKDVQLVIAGPSGWNAGVVHRAIERCDRAGRVRHVGRVSNAQLAALYRRCIAVCVPSIAEGFGLPVLEAADNGAPVVASDLPVFRELAPAVALWAEPSNEAAWATALERIVNDDALRALAIERGRSTAQTYSWTRTATITMAAYERALQPVGAS